MNAIQMTITPAIAADWLTKLHDQQRRLNARHVNRLAGEISRGEWVLNGDTIKLDSNNRVVDGQHRLAAVVKAGTDIQSVVVFGLPEGVIHHIDRDAKPRSFSDVLSMQGIRNTALVAAIATRLHTWESGSTTPLVSAQTPPSASQLHSVVARWPEIHEAATIVSGRSRHVMLAPSAMGTLLALALVSDREKATTFAAGIADGIGLQPGDPRNTLREWAMRHRLRETRPTADAYWNALASAWGAYAAGRPLHRIQAVGRSTPEIVGVHPRMRLPATSA